MRCGDYAWNKIMPKNQYVWIWEQDFKGQSIRALNYPVFLLLKHHYRTQPTTLSNTTIIQTQTKLLAKNSPSSDPYNTNFTLSTKKSNYPPIISPTLTSANSLFKNSTKPTPSKLKLSHYIHSTNSAKSVKSVEPVNPVTAKSTKTKMKTKPSPKIIAMTQLSPSPCCSIKIFNSTVMRRKFLKLLHIHPRISPESKLLKLFVSFKCPT